MGVLGLWDILESVGHPVKVEGLEGKVLGVDANIWLYKFIRGFRDKDNATNIEGHKLGLYNRIAKLLFYRIKPVFVFDGPAPILKRRTLERRQNIRNKTLSKVQDAAMKALANQIKSQYPNADIDHLRITLPELRSNNLVAAEKLGEEDFDLFYLPPESEMKKEKDEEESESEYDSDIELMGDLQYSTKVDVNSKDFQQLPPEVRYEILQDVKSSRRRIRNAESLPDDANSFSNFQLERLRTRRKIQEKIEECEKDICTNYTGELADGRTVQAYRVQSDATSTILYRNNTYDPRGVISPKKESDDTMIKKKKEEAVDLPIIPDIDSDSSTTDIDEPINRSQSQNEVDRRALVNERLQMTSQQQQKHVTDLQTTADKVEPERNNSETARPKISDKTVTKAPDSPMKALASRIRSHHPNAPINQLKTTPPNVKSKNQSTPAKRVDSDSSFLSTESGEKNEKQANNDTIELSESEEESSEEELVEVKEKTNATIELSESDELDSDIEIVVSTQSSTKTDLGSKVGSQQSPASKVISQDIGQPSTSDRNKLVEELLSDDSSTHSHSQKELNAKTNEDKIEDIYTNDTTQKTTQPEVTTTSTTTTTATASTSGVSSQSLSQNIERRPTVSQVIEGSSSQMTSQSEHIMNAQRSTNKVTNKIIEDAKELLRLFGIPYMDATGEAEAQCAKLEELKLTAGTITDDSDIWLFGAQNVYRYFFSDDKYVMQYKMTDIEYHIRMTRDNLVCFAMLVGSDYTDGIMNVGPVTALEILSEFPGEGMEPLVKYSDWHQEALRDKKLTKGADKKKRKKLLKYQLPEEFPSRAVYEGYLRPCADSSAEAFTWGVPELDELREYARRNFGWDQRKVDEKLLPVMKKLSEGKIQKTIDSFFFKTQANRNPEMFRSKRVNQALNKIAKRAALAPGPAPPKVVDEVNLSEDEE